MFLTDEFELTFVFSAKALSILDCEVFDIILMDISMPEMNGFEATSLIRQQEMNTTKRTPIIALTAHVMKDYDKICIENGMDGYVSKPIDREALYQEIINLTQRRKEV